MKILFPIISDIGGIICLFRAFTLYIPEEVDYSRVSLWVIMAVLSQVIQKEER